MKSYDEIAKNVLARRDEHRVVIAKRKKAVMRIGVPTVSLCLAVIIGVGMWQSGDLETKERVEDAIVPGVSDVIENKDDKHFAEDGTRPAIDTEAMQEGKPSGDKEECGNGDEIAIEPHWAEKALYLKYPEFEHGGTMYNTAATWIDEEKVGDILSTTTAYGYDIYEDKAYEIGITVYFINGINTKAAVAVSYDGFDGQYAVYTDNWYKPETLGEFIDSLSLRDNLTFGSIYHTFFEYESYMTVEYKISDPWVIWDMLLSDGSLVNVADEVSDKEMSYYKESMSVSVNVDILGIKNVSLSATENGYISTNILGTRKLFYIGEEKVQEFFSFVEANFEGVREEPPSTTAAVTVADDSKYPEDVVVTAVTETSKPYIPEIIVEE